MASADQHNFVSRAGLKLAHALDTFDFDVTDLTCADFGCNVGGFTDCLLQRGAAEVYAIDTGYGTLAWKLRSDDRVHVLERTNALHADPPAKLVDLVTIDLSWTPQRLAIPAAARWLAPGGHIITLVKPHYELTDEEKERLLVDGQLAPDQAERVLTSVIEQMPEWGVRAINHTTSPITGRKSSKKSRGTRGNIGPGNTEFLVLAKPVN